MSLRLGIIAVLLFIASTSYGEDAYTVENTILLPPTHYIGDVVEARVTVRVNEGISLSTPETYPSDETCTIHSVSIREEKEKAVIQITFSPFTIGERQLPPITLGDISLTGITYHTTSLLEEKEVGFQDIRGQLLLPGTYLLVIAITSTLVLFGFAIIPGIRMIKRVITTIITRRRRRIPFIRLSQIIERLRKQIETIDGKTFYAELGSGIKRYFRDRLALELTSKTTTEVKSLLRHSLETEEQWHTIIGVFEFADRVKFGGYTASCDRRKQDLDHIVTITAALEEVERHHVES